MGALAMPFQNLPLGFRFKPTDVELIDHYLRLKINGKENEVACIKEVDICRVEPWDLPDLSAIKTDDLEWFFFCPRDRKYPNGQRSNRATEAGYWKATGKDRSIKSRKMGLIGMKKTLVFYTGRAPKGQRTHWVIHEYRTTLQELDGSHPGQGAFVLCRLFKKADDLKQDDNDDGSHDEVEPNICSPNPTNVTQEDIRSEPALIQASPLSVEQSVEQQLMYENCVVKTSDSLTSDTAYRPHVNEEMTPEVDSRFTEPSYFFDDPSPELYFKSQDEGLSCMDDIFPSATGDGYNGLHSQDINGGVCLSDFLDPTLIIPDVPVSKEAAHQGAVNGGSDMWQNSSIKESGSCSGSDVEVAQLQYHNHGMTVLNGNKELHQDKFFNDDDDIFSDASLDRFCNLPSTTEPIYCPPRPACLVEAGNGPIPGHNGITIRSYNHERKLASVNFNVQGTAPRRLRLEISSISREPEDNAFAPQVNSIYLEDSAIASHDELGLRLEDLGENVTGADATESSVHADEVIETGIKIRTQLQRSRPTASNSVAQGTARRRIRLQRRPVVSAESVKTLTEENGGKQCAEDTDGKHDQKPGSFKKQAPLHISKVVMVVFFLVACFSLLIVRNVFLLPS